MAQLLCQECKARLKPHISLQDVSPAAYNLVIPGLGLHDSDSKKTPSNISLGINSNGDKGSTSSSIRAYPNETTKSTSNDRDTYNDASQDNSQALVRRTVPGPPPRYPQSTTGNNTQNPQDSFVMLSNSVLQAPEVSSPTSNKSQTSKTQLGSSVDEASRHKMTSARLFDVISARSDVDHPICGECTDILIEGLTARLATSTKERDAYQVFYKRAQNDLPSAEEIEATRNELEDLKHQESYLMDDLENWEHKKADLEAVLQELEEESKKIDLEEEEFWKERNAMAQELEEYQNERDSVNLRYDYDAKQLEKLQRTNIYNDAYCIGHDGFFGTINGLRLGKLPEQGVDWPEINAAWGQTLLLLHTVAEKLGFMFEGYRFKLLGSTSKIEKIDIKNPKASSTGQQAGANKIDARVSTYELFSSNSIPMGHLFAHRKFDLAMVAFLDCVKQLGDWVEKKDPNNPLPYKIEKDKIGDVSIRLTFNQDEAWTRACKYTLTCAKFLLAHASNQSYKRTPATSEPSRER